MGKIGVWGMGKKRGFQDKLSWVKAAGRAYCELAFIRHKACHSPSTVLQWN